MTAATPDAADLPPIRGRLLLHPPAGAAWNMAVDQAVLESTARSGVPTLRFYRWQQPTLSLGYFQMADDRHGHRESRSLTLVRRATGGGAIVHDAELTYSLAVPLAHRRQRAVQTLYDMVHQTIVRCLDQLGVPAMRFADAGHPPAADPAPFLCFQRRTADDLVLAGYKVVGSAQRRAAAAILQHGSILLQASRHAPQLPGIVDLTGGHWSADELQQRLAFAMPTLCGDAVRPAQWIAGALSGEERERAAQLAQEKFGSDDWTYRRTRAADAP